MRFAGPLALVLALTAATYGPTLDHSFQYDDDTKIVENSWLRDPTQLFRDFGSGRYSWAASRLLPNLTFVLDHALFGLAPFGYHLTNLLFHLVNVVLVALWGRALFRRAGKADDAAALFGAALFAVHPLNTEAVNYCNARPNVLVTTFYLAALVMCLRATARASDGAPRGRGLAWAAFGVAALLALLCKEMALTLVATAPLMLWWFPSGDASVPVSRRTLALAGAALLAAGVGVSLVTGAVFGAHDVVIETGGAVTGNWLTYIVVTALGQSEVFLRYFGLALVPWPGFLNIDHRALGHLHERLFQHGHVVAGAVGVVLVPLASFGLLLAVLRAIFLWRRRAAIPTFLALWPFLTHAVNSLVPSGEVMVEYRTYLPMAGLCVGFAWGLRGLAAVVAARLGRAPGRGALRVASALLVLVLVVGTLVRNRAWATPETMWEDSIRKAPSNPRAHNGLGIAARARGDMAAALTHFRRAVEVDPNYPESQNNLGALLAQRGESEEAARHLAAAIRLSPTQSDAYNNLGNVLTRLGRLDDALASYRRALEITPRFPEAEMNMGMALARRGDVDGALEHYRRSVALEPGLSVARLLVGRALLAKGNVQEALASLRRAVQLAPDDADPHAELGKALSYRGDYAGAIKELERAVALDPSHREANAYLQELRRIGATR